MTRLTPDTLIMFAGQLEDLAGRITGFTQFIRRDLGSKGVHATVVGLLRKHGLEGNTELAEDIITLTEKLRQTTRDYYVNRMLEPADDNI